MKSPYLNTRDLAERYRCTPRTIFRMMRKSPIPLPPPVIKEVGAKNLWLAEDIENYDIQRMAAQKMNENMRYFYE